MKNQRLQVLLVHPGGPFWRNKDDGAWAIPKGQVNEGEELLDAARREFEEETGFKPTGPFTPLAPIRQKAGKIVHAWYFEGDCDPAQVRSNSCQMEWPPRSGRQIEFPEVDRAGWFELSEAEKKILASQMPLLLEFEQKLLRGA